MNLQASFHGAKASAGPVTRRPSEFVTKLSWEHGWLSTLVGKEIIFVQPVATHPRNYRGPLFKLGTHVVPVRNSVMLSAAACIPFLFPPSFTPSAVECTLQRRIFGARRFESVNCAPLAFHRRIVEAAL